MHAAPWNARSAIHSTRACSSRHAKDLSDSGLVAARGLVVSSHFWWSPATWWSSATWWSPATQREQKFGFCLLFGGLQRLRRGGGASGGSSPHCSTPRPLPSSSAQCCHLALRLLCTAAVLPPGTCPLHPRRADVGGRARMHSIVFFEEGQPRCVSAPVGAVTRTHGMHHLR
jgi:hypothetical protein